MLQLIQSLSRFVKLHVCRTALLPPSVSDGVFSTRVIFTFIGTCTFTFSSLAYFAIRVLRIFLHHGLKYVSHCVIQIGIRMTDTNHYTAKVNSVRFYMD